MFPLFVNLRSGYLSIYQTSFENMDESSLQVRMTRDYVIDDTNIIASSQLKSSGVRRVSMVKEEIEEVDQNERAIHESPLPVQVMLPN